jgi:hypothetical protein
MAKTLNLRAPDAMCLKDMQAADIEAYVLKLADDALTNLPDGMRPHSVNTVALNQTTPATQGKPGISVMWERACCGHRNQIEDFEDPVIEQFELDGSPLRRQLAGEHVESRLTVTELEHPTQHVAGDA